jgi:hypothetical protein
LVVTGGLAGAVGAVCVVDCPDDGVVAGVDVVGVVVLAVPGGLWRVGVDAWPGSDLLT